MRGGRGAARSSQKKAWHVRLGCKRHILCLCFCPHLRLTAPHPPTHIYIHTHTHTCTHMHRYDETDRIIAMYKRKALQPLPGCNEEQTLEAKIAGELNAIRESAAKVSVCVGEGEVGGKGG